MPANVNANTVSPTAMHLQTEMPKPYPVLVLDTNFNKMCSRMCSALHPAAL